MDGNELWEQEDNSQSERLPHPLVIYIRGVLGWNSGYASKGIPFILEGFYMWLGKRLPAGLVYRASSQMLEYADQQGLQPHEIAGFMEVQSLWLTDKMP